MLKQFLLLVILLIYTILIINPIRLTIGDLGRHLKNGELIMNNLSVPRTNLFTYTNGDYPFINHHWGSGVIFYLINKAIRLSGLHISFILLNLVTFLIFFNIACKYSNFYLAVWLSILILPLLASRPDIRPEIFSNFFSGVFFWILINYQRGKIKAKYLICLPLISFVWVNLHIYFFIGLTIITAFCLEAFIRLFEKKVKFSSIKNLLLVLITSFVASLVNPFGIAGALYPLKIFSNYGYEVGENTSALTWQNVTSLTPDIYFLSAMIVFLLSSVVVCIQSIKFRKPIPVALLTIGSVVTSLSLMSVRNFAIFGYFMLAIIAINVWTLISYQSKKTPLKGWVLPSLGFVTIVLVVYYVFFGLKGKILFNIGLKTEEEKSAEFFIENRIKGPIFNDFDIGGYLVYYLYPKYQLFIDNRPEAVPASFFRDIYIPVLENDKKWQEASEKYHFNAIFFYRLDRTEPAIKFLLNRIKDPEWAVVFVDNYTIIFLRENDVNKEIIKKYKIPKDATLIYGSLIKSVTHEAIF